MTMAMTDTSDRVTRSVAIRTATAEHDGFVPAPTQVANGDEVAYEDKSGTYTKCVLQSGLGLVDLAAYDTFRTALDSGSPADFDAIVLGGTRTLNGPQGGLAFNLDCLDVDQFAVPPAPPLSSEWYATELVELYWASLLRDVAFTDYGTNATAAAAAAELSAMTYYKGPRQAGQVTPAVLFRGGFGGETVGPYLSQFLLQNTALGALPVVQKYATSKPGVNFMTDPTTFQQVQNGISTGLPLTPAAAVFAHDGRGMSAYTHVDVLYQAYLIAFLVLNTADNGAAVPPNPGLPYVGDKTQNGFATLGGPDASAMIGAVASLALKAVWYQKWFIHLRHRPESGGGIVHLIKTGKGNTIQGHVSDVVLNSAAVAKCFAANNSYLLSQAFPEGSPAHPAYPTGHGTVAGACITILKFFFQNDFVLPKPVVSSNGGSTLTAYAGGDAGQITVNGELHKLAHNVSFGHGVHAGIHWRSDTDTSIQLGEAVALSYLRDRAATYNERFTVAITKLDGTTATITNE